MALNPKQVSGILSGIFILLAGFLYLGNSSGPACAAGDCVGVWCNDDYVPPVDGEGIGPRNPDGVKIQEVFPSPGINEDGWIQEDRFLDGISDDSAFPYKELPHYSADCEDPPPPVVRPADIEINPYVSTLNDCSPGYVESPDGSCVSTTCSSGYSWSGDSDNFGCLRDCPAETILHGGVCKSLNDFCKIHTNSPENGYFNRYVYDKYYSGRLDVPNHGYCVIKYPRCNRAYELGNRNYPSRYSPLQTSFRPFSDFEGGYAVYQTMKTSCTYAICPADWVRNPSTDDCDRPQYLSCPADQRVFGGVCVDRCTGQYQWNFSTASCDRITCNPGPKNAERWNSTTRECESRCTRPKLTYRTHTTSIAQYCSSTNDTYLQTTRPNSLPECFTVAITTRRHPHNGGYKVLRFLRGDEHFCPADGKLYVNGACYFCQAIFGATYP